MSRCFRRHALVCATCHPHLELNEHAFAAHTAGAPQVIDVLVFLIQLPSAHCFFTGAVVTCGHRLNRQAPYFWVLRLQPSAQRLEGLTHKCKVALQKFPVRVEPGVSQAAVLVLADNVVHNVRQQACHHQDLHVITLPAVLQMCRNLQRQSKVRRITGHLGEDGDGCRGLDNSSAYSDLGRVHVRRQRSVWSIAEVGVQEDESYKIHFTVWIMRGSFVEWLVFSMSPIPSNSSWSYLLYIS